MEIDTDLRLKSMEWFFSLNELQKFDLKKKHLNNIFIQHSSKWGYHYTLGQIEQMYLAETTPSKGGEDE